jgi:hypothetical protein
MRSLPSFEDAHAAALDGAYGDDERARALWLALDAERLAADGRSQLGDVIANAIRGEEGAAARALALESEAAAASDARRVVEAAALAAHAALGAGRLDEARSLARRASRMARTEAIPEAEYFAHIELARVRRHDGRPHLALRILGALARVAPSPWHPRIAWETAMAGGITSAAELVRALPASLVGSAAHDAVSALLALLDAAVRGAQRDFATMRETAGALVSDVAFARRDLEDAAAALDASREPGAARGDLAAFLDGAASMPLRLAGLAGIAPPSGEPSGVWVVAGPRRATRRVLAAGLPLTGEAVARLVGDTRQLRTERAAATLLLAGPEGLAREEFFERVYGFAFKPVTHQSVLDVLLHRVRALLEGHAQMTRDEEVVAVTTERDVAAPEGADAAPLEDRVLRALAERGELGARDAASALGIPLRTAQAALARLVDEGACFTERRGRAIAYRVEDTTFSEPTRPGEPAQGS